MVAGVGTGLAGGIAVVALVVAGSWQDAGPSATPAPAAAADQGEPLVAARTPSETTHRAAEVEPTRTVAADAAGRRVNDAFEAAPPTDAWRDRATPLTREAVVAAFADMSPPALDERTAAIGGPFEPVPVDEVVVAETEEQVAMLEEIQRAENEVLIASLREDGVDYSSEIATGMREATIRSHVNLRDAPGNNSNVLAIVPGNARVQASQECKLRWCAVIYEGQSGYVYEGFIR